MAFEYDKEKVDALIVLSQKGKSEAFGEVYDTFVDVIYRYIYFRVKNEDVEDLVEIVFLKAWDNINTYKKGKYPFSSWLFRIAHNLVVDYYRTRQVDVSLDEKLADTIEAYKREHQPLKRAENELNSEILQNALSALKKPHQDFIILKFINEFSNEEIAKIMDKRVSSLRVLQYRALKELRTYLKSFEFDIL